MDGKGKTPPPYFQPAAPLNTNEEREEQVFSLHTFCFRSFRKERITFCIIRMKKSTRKDLYISWEKIKRYRDLETKRCSDQQIAASGGEQETQFLSFSSPMCPSPPSSALLPFSSSSHFFSPQLCTQEIFLFVDSLVFGPNSYAIDQYGNFEPLIRRCYLKKIITFVSMVKKINGCWQKM